MTGARTGPPEPVDGLRLEIDAGVATLWLDRPAKRNAVTYEMWLGIADQCRRLADDHTVRLLVVRGVGEHFCAGADIGGLRDVPADEYRRANEAADVALASFPKPSIAAISGSCIGGGTEIAVACDVRIADTTSRFGITPARLGIVYPAGATTRVVQLIGAAATKHLLFSAEIVDSDRASQIGLVDEVVAAGQLDQRVGELATLLTEERSLLTQMASKEIVDAIATGAAGTDVEARWQHARGAGTERAEGIAAFLERRPPRFTWTPDGDAD
jgi:enoyl-CoA hydratase/carnithine racemase